MKRLAWLTDVHLDFLSDDAVSAHARYVAATGATAVLLTGDISIEPRLARHLQLLEAVLDRPIYFVLGNHDAYRGSIESAQKVARELTASTRHLRWLPEVGVVPITDRTCVLGCDGWADARLGDFDGSGVMLNDFLLIQELSGLTKAELRRRLEAQGDRWGAWARRHLEEALATYAHVIFLTHVPPFRESCWYDGRISDDQWLPHFTCKAVGDALLEAADKRPDRRITVLCGHTHGAGEADLRPNLKVLTGSARYGAPHVQRVFEFHEPDEPSTPSPSRY